MVQELTDATFSAEIANATPIIVDFWASWCGPCKRMAPIFEGLAPSYEGKLRFAKVNVEENEATGGSQGISSIPAFIVYKDGKEVGRIVGGMDEGSFKAKIDEILASL